MNITTAILDVSKSVNASLAPTLKDLANGFNASISIASAPAVSQTLTGVGNITASALTVNTVYTAAADMFSQLWGMWGG